MKEIYLKNIKEYKSKYHQDQINAVFDRVYNVVFMDIDKTIIDEDKFDIDLLKILYTILSRGVNIYFITGRGRTSAKNIITELIIKMTANLNKSKMDFVEQIFLITNNGLNLFYTDKSKDDTLFNKRKILINEERIETFLKNKEGIIGNIIEVIKNSNTTRLNTEELERINKSYSGELSIRFAFSSEDIIDIDKLLNSLNTLIKDSYPEYHVFKGLYKDKKVVEVSLVDKEDALNYLLPILGVEKQHVLKIGDQGAEFGNDYLFLNSEGGFSVDEFDFTGSVLPIIDNEGVVLKGIQASKYLLKNIKIFPTVCLNNANKKLYKTKLAKYENVLEHRSKEILEKYDKLISKSFSTDTKTYGISNIIDNISGGIYISDAEYTSMKNMNPNHLLFSLFSIKENSKNIYLIQDDNGYILRGSRNYYYGLAFRPNKGMITKKLADDINRNYLSFLDLAVTKMRERKHEYTNEYIDRKVLLGIMDNIRNMLLLFLNVLIQNEVNDNNVIIDLENTYLKNFTNAISKNLQFMYRVMFYGNYYSLYNEYLSFLEVDILGKIKNIYLEKYNSLEEDFNYKKAFRVWRETDNFLENIMVVENEISQYYKKTAYNFYGMRYGAIELPFIIRMLLNEKGKNNLENSFFIISSKNNYFMNHSDNNKDKYLSFQIKTESEFDAENKMNVILEDNILTGRTLQVVINNFLDNKIYIDKIVIVRYPTINRLEHMFIKEGHGCPNVDLFFNKITGLISRAPYSKFNGVYEGRTKENLYKDELGIFNINREKVLRYLYKNKDFSKDSEVNYLVEGVQNEYIRY